MENNQQNFWIIQAQENPAEARSLISRREWRSNTLSEALSDRGHDVTRWRSSFSHQSKQQLSDGSEQVDAEGYKLQFIYSPDYRRHIGIGRIVNHMSLARNFSRLSKERKAEVDLIHVANVPILLCYAAVKFGKKNNIPVIVDIRDLWPDIYLDSLPKALDFLKPILQRIIDLSSFRVKYIYRHSTAITALTEKYLQWGLEKGHRERRDVDAIFSMCYPEVPKSKDGARLQKIRAKIGLQETDIVATYLGNIGYQSDFQTVIAAARNLATKKPELKFVIAGSGPMLEPLKTMARDLPNVIFPGWLSGEDVQDLMRVSKIGLIAFKPVKNYLMNIPNKYPEYLAGGLAIACGLEGEMGQLTREGECGFVYRTGDPVDFADQILNVTQQSSMLENMSQAARSLHAKRFLGSKIYPEFATHLEQIATLEKKI